MLVKKTRKIGNSVFTELGEVAKTDQTHYLCGHFVFRGGRFVDNKPTVLTSH